MPNKYSKKVNIAISVLIIVILVLTSTASAFSVTDDYYSNEKIDIKLEYNSDSEDSIDQESKDISCVSNSEDKPTNQIKNRICDFLISLSERFPRLGSLPFIKRLIDRFGPADVDDDSGDDGDDNITSDDSNNGDNSGDNNDDEPDPYDYPDPNDNDGPSEEELLEGITHTDENYPVFSTTNLDDGKLLGSSDSENITIIPDSGHFVFGGHGQIELDLLMNINGSIVTITGLLYIGPEEGTVEISWNISKGYFEITGNEYFEFTDLYFNVDNKIIFNVDSLVFDSDGHLLIDKDGAEGCLELDGAIELEGLSFSIEDVQHGNVTFGGTFDLSSIVDANDFRISWNETGFSADGSLIANAELNIYNFYLSLQSIALLQCCP